MNRKKKLNDAYNKKLKKLNSKLKVSNKPKYISKADREKVVEIESDLRVDDASIVSEAQL